MRRIRMETTNPRTVGEALGVSEASIKRWCDQGLIYAERTAGGHRRITVGAVIDFMRKNGRGAERPELLGLPTTLGMAKKPADMVDAVYDALREGDHPFVQRLIFDLYLRGATIPEIGDDLLAPVFVKIGEQWEHGKLEIYVEHRAVEIATRVIHFLGTLVETKGENPRRAMGGSLNGDLYSLPSLLVELTLREEGWRAQTLGPNQPHQTIAAAVRIEKPDLVWMSFSHNIGDDLMASATGDVYREATAIGAALVVGGRALTPDVRKRMSYSTFCDGLRHLVGFVRSLPKAPGQAPASVPALT